MHGVYIIDADNTLWDTNRVYTGALRSMLSALKAQDRSFPEDFPFEVVRTADRAIAKALGEYEYDARVLALALVYHARGLEAAEAARQALAGQGENDPAFEIAARAAQSFYGYLHENPPPLFDGAKETLAALLKAGNVLILHSEGRHDRVLKTLALHQLDGFFHRVVIERKSETSFRQARALGQAMYSRAHAVPPCGCIVVGDSPQRDILFGNLIGALTVMKVGGMWGASIPHDPLHQPDYVISHWEELLHLEPHVRGRRDTAPQKPGLLYK
ncbi:MAG: HAD family hydrolase [Desulfotomaculales bacterium]